MPDLSENISQSMAISHFQGPALVLAGPGSGKTFTITKRIQYLIEQCKVKPEHILVVTFTRAAASEMKERFLKLTGEKSSEVSFGTFHACFYSILRRACYPAKLELLSEQEKRIRVREAVRRYEQEEQEINQDSGSKAGRRFWTELSPESEESLLQDLSRYKNSGQKMSAYEPLSVKKEMLAYVWKELEQYKQLVHRIDFDDMAIQCYTLFLKQPELLKQWQEKFQYILVDEFQDINELQYRVMCLLAGEKKNLFMVGDDDQSIYGFRGARPEIMKRVLRDFPECSTMLLEQNYRSSGNIIRAAGYVIRENKNRMAKEIRAVRDAGQSVRIREFESRQDETEFLMQELSALWQKEKETGNAERKILEDTAVIFRTNREMADFAGHLIKKGIPFSMKETGRNMFDTAVARDIRTYLRFAQGERYRNDFYQIMNRPLRYIPRDIVKGHTVHLGKLLHDCERYYPGLVEEVEKFSEDMERMSTMQPYAAIRYLRKGVGYDEHIRTMPDAEDKLELAEQITDSARGYATLAEWENYIEEYAAKLSAASSDRETKGWDGVQMMTMHASKGLEYKRVYLPHLNEGSIPHKKSEAFEELEEERRMLYVSMTRAKDSLCMTYVKDKQKAASRFLEPLLKGKI
ncbi:MAG: ATP-dependent helicase [Clostridiales bacterium]|nr:ATP-dependent helicase [Clostridiales bacterium]